MIAILTPLWLLAAGDPGPLDGERPRMEGPIDFQRIAHQLPIPDPPGRERGNPCDPSWQKQSLNFQSLPRFESKQPFPISERLLALLVVMGGFVLIAWLLDTVQPPCRKPTPGDGD